MKDLVDNLTDLWTFQYLSKQVGKISTSWHPSNSDLANIHCFADGMVAYRKMLLLGSRFKHGDTIDHQLIFYIHGSVSFDSHV